MTRSAPPPRLEVLEEDDYRGRPVTVIVERHQMPPHDVVASIRITAPSELQRLVRRLKHRLDVALEDTRARAQRPEACGRGYQVARRPSLDQLDGDDA